MLGDTIQKFGFARTWPETSLRNFILRETPDLPDQKKILKELLKNKIDWPKFLRESISERIGPLTYYNLNKGGLIDLLPGFAKEALFSRYCFVTSRNKAQTDFLKEVLPDLENISAPIALKGIVFSHIIYEDPGLREYSDIDLLVEKKDLFQIDKVLTQKWKMRCFLDCPGGKTYELDNYQGGFPQKLDLIWDLAPIDRFARAINWDTERARSNSRGIIIQDKKVRVLSWEDAIIYSVYHLAFHHRFNGIVWYVDLLKIIDKFQDVLDWEEIEICLTRYALSGVFYSILRTLKEQLGCQIDYSRLNNFKRGRGREKINNISKNYLEDKTIVLGGLRNEIKMAFLFDRLSLTCKVLFRLIFPSCEWLEFNFLKEENPGDKKAFFRRRKILQICYCWLSYLKWARKSLFNKNENKSSACCN